MLTVHYSNRLETLAAELAALTREPLASPLTAEVVIVQSRGVARWLALRLADQSGVCANVRFPFPTAFAWELYRSAFGNVPEHSPFDPEVLTWRILGLLPALEPSPMFAPVGAYVQGEPLRRFELAVRLAGLFDEYLVYRADWIARWERAKPEHWQAALWQRLTRDVPAPHRAALHAQLVEKLAGTDPEFALPERVSIFGAPALPPVLLELFTALGRHSDVHLFVQNPCREYWGDIRGEGDVARSRLERKHDAAYLETGNSLLASLGKQGRDFIDLLTAIEAEDARGRDRYEEPGRASLLAAIQSDILDLREGPGGTRSAIAPADASLQVHSCHSAMREVEVLHDQLLALFSRWPDLEPSDVVVMTPDIETYAPYIEAVFDTAEEQIPFNISDRSSERESTLAATFMSLLELRGSRYEAERVLAVLDEPAVRRRFRLAEGDVETIRAWVREAQIRWGIDAAHRAGFGLPRTHEHTWRFGLERLLLGYALPGRNERLFGGVLPYDEIEGSLGIVLGRFVSYAEAAIALDSDFAGMRPVARWCELMQRLIATFFDPEEHRAEELQAVRSAVAAIEREVRAARYSEPVPLAVLIAVLHARLEVPGRAFLAGGVTFCAMVPMRSLPFRVVCMIGMNDRAYPRMRRRDGFDLMAADFRKGDRSRRDDDRYLFLESILNARRCLYLSYTGRHVREDTVIPPSVLVSELLDYVERAYRAADGASLRGQLVTEHPLQAFSRRYFEGGRLFSYSQTHFTAATAAGRGTRAAQPFMTAALPPPDAETRVVDLDSFVRFFRNPARHLCETRLRVRLEPADEELDSREPFELGGLALYKLKERLLDLRLRGEVHEGLGLARAGGVLPHARMGEVLFEAQGAIVERVAEKARSLMPGALLEPRSFELTAHDVTLTGTLGSLSADGMLIYRVAKASAHVRVNAWIRHLALNAYPPRGAGRISRCVSEDCILTFAPVEDARERLAELLALYWQGLHRPLHFFPRTACEYASERTISNKVITVWQGSYPDYRGERNDPYFCLAFRGLDPLDDEFRVAAEAVFLPMSAALTEEALK